MRQLCTRHWQLVARRFARYSIRCLCEYTHVTQSLVPNDTSAATLASTCHKGAALDAGLDLLAAQDLTVPPESSALAATWKANADTGSSTPVPKPATRPKKSRKQERFIERSLHATCSRVHVLFQDKDPDSLPVLDGPTKAKYAKYWNNLGSPAADPAAPSETSSMCSGRDDASADQAPHGATVLDTEPKDPSQLETLPLEETPPNAQADLLVEAQALLSQLDPSALQRLLSAAAGTAPVGQPTLEGLPADGNQSTQSPPAPTHISPAGAAAVSPPATSLQASPLTLTEAELLELDGEALVDAALASQGFESVAKALADTSCSPTSSATPTPRSIQAPGLALSSCATALPPPAAQEPPAPSQEPSQNATPALATPPPTPQQPPTHHNPSQNRLQQALATHQEGPVPTHQPPQLAQLLEALKLAQAFAKQPPHDHERAQAGEPSPAAPAPHQDGELVHPQHTQQKTAPAPHQDGELVHPQHTHRPAQDLASPSQDGELVHPQHTQQKPAQALASPPQQGELVQPQHTQQMPPPRLAVISA